MRAILLAAGLCLAGLAGAASAATVTFTMDSTSQDGFNLDFRSVSGNCPGDASCAALNLTQSDLLTYDGGKFDLLGLSFKLVGEAPRNTFRIQAFEGATQVFSKFFSVTDYLKNTAYEVQLSLFGVDSVLFSHSGGGNVRYDDLVVGPVAPIPLPAGGLLLLGGLGGLALLRRRKSV